jgi:choline dehydrogenase-like flavoprotein
VYSGIGGTAAFFAGVWSRPLPSDFRVRTLDGVAADWPLEYNELHPFFEAIDADVGASGLPGNPAYPAPGFNPPLPPHPIHKTGRRMAEGMNKLGWHWWPGYSAIPSQDHRHQKQCVRLGVCRLGCVAGAKGSPDVTHVPDAIRHGARFVTGARVSEITLDEHGLANGAVYFQEGTEHFQRASVVVVGANAVGTARLLLMSKSNRFPDGLANSSGLVGKNLMLHPFATVVGVYDDFLEDWLGPAGIQIESMEFYETDTSRGFVRGSKWHVMGTGGPLEMLTRWRVGEGVRDEEFWGEQFAGKMKRSVGHCIDWTIHAEDLPEESNYVTLDPELKDSDGLPAPKVYYRTSENTKRIFDFALDRALESHEAAGAAKAWVVSRNFTSGHNLGTARMGNDPETSVVDRFGRAHDVPNLFVIDGSVFPTSTATNPTATICALAMRTAMHIVNKARNQKVAA